MNCQMACKKHFVLYFQLSNKLISSKNHKNSTKLGYLSSIYHHKRFSQRDGAQSALLCKFSQEILKKTLAAPSFVYFGLLPDYFNYNSS